MSNLDISRDPEYLRASTARVDHEVIVSRLRELRSSIAARATSFDEEETSASDSIKTNAGGNICEFDLSKNVLDYLPNPIIAQSQLTERSGSKSLSRDDEYRSRRTLLGNSKFLGVQESATKNIDEEEEGGGGIEGLDMDPPFKSMFDPTDMRLLALVSHNNMKHAMKQFVIANKNVLKKFRLTGTNTTMSMLREVFGDDPEVVYGPSCKSGPLGGDAQLVAMAVTSQLGGCIFFIDPMDAHPHSADIECLVRQGNVHNILMMNNPTTAHICLNTLRVALKMGRMEMFPSFFFDLESPSVEAYKMRQKAVLESAILRTSRSSSIKEVVVRPIQSAVSILRQPSRNTKILESMERANSASLKHRASTMKKVAFSVDKPIGKKSSPRKGMEDFLPTEEAVVEVEEIEDSKKAKKKAKKKKFKFF